MHRFVISEPLNHKTQQGFTLIEVIMVMVISSILAIGITAFISQTTQTLLTAPQRLALATSASLIVDKISRDIRSALPNSVRVFDDGGNSCIELVPILNSSEYLSIPIAGPQSSFQAIRFINAVGGESGYVSVYPSSVAEVYNTASNTVTQVRATASAPSVAPNPGLQTISFGATNVQFANESPARRFYLTAQPVAFCEDGAGRVWRYFDYGFHADSRSSLPTSAANRVVVGDRLVVGSLTFNIIPAQLQRNAMVRISLSVVSDDGESVQLAQEVQLRNVP